MGKHPNKVATPSAWVRIDPYTGKVTRKGKAPAQQPVKGLSFSTRSAKADSHIPPVPVVQPKVTPSPVSVKDAQASAVSLRSGFVRCDACGASLKETRLARHQQEKCPARLAQITIHCPNCKQRFVREQLNLHMQSCRPRPKSPAISRSSSPNARANSRPLLSNGAADKKTGVFYDEGNFIVMYRGKVIHNVGDAGYGWELLELYRKRIEQK
jgi:hypothetical protein